MNRLGFLILWMVASVPAIGEMPPASPKGDSGLANATVLIIRHAEKPDSGVGLSPAGTARANAYVHYFETYQIDSLPIKVDALFAAADSGSSQRPRLTLKPLSRSLGLAINTQFKDREDALLVKSLQSTGHGRYILICWHHGRIPALLGALGADPQSLLGGKKWPGDQYGWVIQLAYDETGRLKGATRIEEPLRL